MRYAMILYRRPFVSLVLLACLAFVGCDGGSGGDVEHGRLTVLVDVNVGDGGSALAAPLDARQLAIAANGDLLLAGALSVRRVDARTRTITSVPGTTLDACADGTSIEGPCGANVVAVAVDRGGDIWFAVADGRIFRVGPAGGEREHVLGQTAAHCPDGLPLAGRADEVCFRSVSDLAFDRAGHLFVADASGARVFRFDPRSRTVRIVAGDGDVLSSDCADDVPGSETCIGVPVGVAVDVEGGVLIAAPGLPVRRVDPATGVISRIARRSEPCFDGDPNGDGGPARDACLWSVSDVTTDARGDLFIADAFDGTIRRVDAATGTIGTFATPGAGTYDQALAVDRNDRLVVLGFMGSFVGQTVRRYDRERLVAIAGNGYFAFCGDGGPARDACLGQVVDVALAPDGAIYVSDLSSRRIRRIADGTITTVAGDGRIPAAGERCPDGIARETCLAGPGDLAVDGTGILYVLDDANASFALNRVRRLDRAGVLTTVVGGCRSDADPTTVAAADACLHVAAIAVAPDDALWIAETDRILRFDAAAERLVPIAAAPAGCDATTDASRPECFAVHDLAFDPAGNLFFADGRRVRRIAAGATSVEIVAGDGTSGDCGDGGPAVDACLVASRVASDAAGNLFIGGSGVVRRVDAASGVVTHVAGLFDHFCVREPADRVVPPDSGCATVAAVDEHGRLLYPELSRFAFGRLVRFTP